MNKLIFSVVLAAASVMPLTSIAEQTDIDDVMMDTTEQWREAAGLRPVEHGARHIIRKYIDEQIASGELDPAEFEVYKAERQALLEEIRSLKDSGDQEALQSKMGELRELRQERRQAMKEFIENNEELRNRLEEYRELTKERRRVDLERLREHFQQTREQDNAES